MIHHSGYMRVKFSKDKKQTIKNIHRLFAEAFIERVENCIRIDHIDVIN